MELPSMRILHCVESYPPSPGGMASVVHVLSEGLVRRGHEVTVATSPNPARGPGGAGGVRVVPFRITGNLAKGLAGEVEGYRQLLRGGGFDVIALFAAQQWATDVALELLGEIPARKVFVPTGFSGLHSPAYADYFRRMPAWLRAMDANVFQGETYRDHAFARRHGVERTTVIPNGASEAEFGAAQPVDVRGLLGIPADHALVLHVGSFTGLKGQREAIAIFRRARLDRTTLLLVGDPANPRESRRCERVARAHGHGLLRFLDRGAIRMVALDRPSTVAAFQQADLFLFPSRIECSPVVLFEAAAAGTPFLSSDAGNAAEIAGWTGAGEILPTRTDGDGRARVEPGPSARQLRRLMADAPRRRVMAEAGRRAWRERFTWEAITARYEALYRSLAP
jgi:glycosyltransferase involved in cell wall biosynthesis